MPQKKESFSYEELDLMAVKAKLGSYESVEKLEGYFLPICLRICSSMIKSYRINLDTSEPGDYIFLIHETMIKSIDMFNPYVGDFKNYFLASFVTNMYSLLEQEHLDNVLLFNAISLDAYVPKTNNRTYHDIIASSYSDDPQNSYIMNEARTIMFSDSVIQQVELSREFTPNERSRMRLQRQLILLRYYGCTLEEIAKIFGVTKAVVRRLLFNDNDYMPLGKLKKIFNKK